jgi:hypothetical protein
VTDKNGEAKTKANTIVHAEEAVVCRLSPAS